MTITKLQIRYLSVKRSWMILLAMVLCVIRVNGQDTTSKQPREIKHEFGLDVSPFIKTYLSLNNRGIASYPYMLTYRRYHDKWNFRAGILLQVESVDIIAPVNSPYRTSIRY